MRARVISITPAPARRFLKLLLILTTDKLRWENVGTSDEPRSESLVGRLNSHPPTHDAGKPILLAYGPLRTQELRERYMVNRIEKCEEPHSVGLFIVGLGHLHSILCRLNDAGLEATGYSWVEQVPQEEAIQE